MHSDSRRRPRLKPPSRPRSAAEATRLAVHAEMEALEERQKMAIAYDTHPALLRLEELTTLRDLA